MKTPFKILILILGVLFGVYTVLGITDMLKMYHLPTTSNEPGLKLNSRIFVSNLVDYNNGDFVCYKYNDELFGEQIWVHRLLGNSGDTIEIKNGVLFLNGRNIDRNMRLKHSYTLDNKEVQTLIDKNLVTDEDIFYYPNDKATVFLLDKVAKLNGLSSKINTEPKNQADKTITEIYGENWNRDNFGPLIIPSGKCFVIGDNRHNAKDSRYSGLINESDIVGAVVRK